MVLAIDGLITPADLQRAVRVVVGRHDALRTSFEVASSGTPAQIVLAKTSFAWQEVAGDGAGEPELLRMLLAAAGRVDLRRPPLVTWAHAQLARDRQVLAVTAPVLVADAESLRIVAADLAALSVGREPARPFQYGAAVAVLNRLLTAEEAATHRAFWTGRLPSSRSRAELPLRRSIGPGAGQASLASTVVLPEGDPMLATVLLAALVVWIARLTEQTTIALGYAAPTRRDETASCVGPFAQDLPLFLDVDSRQCAGELLDRVRRHLVDVGDHREFFSWRALEAAGYAGPFPVTLEMEDAWPRFAERDLTLRVIHLREDPEPRPLTIACRPQSAGRMAVTWRYDAAAFAEADVRAMMAQYAELAGALARADRGTPVADICCLTDIDRAAVAMGRDEPLPALDLTVPTLFARCVARWPDTVCVTDAAGELTYRQLDASVRRLAADLRDRSVRPEVPVAVLVDDSIATIAALLAVMEAGGVFVPLDARQPAARLARQVADCAAALILRPAGLECPPLTAFAGECLSVSVRSAEVAPGRPVASTRAVADNLAYVIYTSGSTGEPKGVAVTHRSVVHYSRHLAARLGLGDRPGLSFATPAGASVDLGYTAVFGALLNGGTLHLVSAQAAADPAEYQRFRERRRPDVLKITPSHFGALAAGSLDRAMPERCLILGGEPLRPDACPPASHAGECAVINHYGPTEATIGCITTRPGDLAAWPWTGPSVPAGHPLGDTRAHVVDEQGRQAPIGVPGELWVGGSCLARGYFARADLTAAAFVPDPFSGRPGARLYRTGDIGRFFPDGTVQILGRRDQQLKVRGFRVEPGEIEAALRQDPAVRHAVVVAESGAASCRLVAFVEPAAPSACDPQRLVALVRSRVPEWMVPADMRVLDRVPRTPGGKVDRHALSALLAGAGAVGPAPEPPRDEIEALLVGIWSAVFRRGGIGVRDNFFDLGGDSILSIQIAARAVAAGLVLSPADLFRYPTVADLARGVELAATGQPTAP